MPGMLSTANTCFGSSCAISSDYMNWIPLIAVAISLSFLICSFAYILGRLLKKPEFEAFAKTEIYYTISAMIWSIIIIGLASSLCVVGCILSDGENPLEKSIAFLQDAQLELEALSQKLLLLARNMRINSAINVIIFPPSAMQGATMNPWAGCSMLADNIEGIGLQTAPYVGSIIIQELILGLIANFAFKLILPIGLVIRILPRTREAGAFLMAIAIGFYIIFPLCYVFADNALQAVQLQKPMIETQLSVVECSNPRFVLNGYKYLGSFLPHAVFFPALATIITISSIRVISKVFMYDLLEA